jgi:hypothetical protein
MKEIFLSFAMIAGMMSASNAARVCAQIGSFCSNSYAARTGSGDGPYCWCGVGDYWSWSGNYMHSGDFGHDGTTPCPSYCSQMCGA